MRISLDLVHIAIIVNLKTCGKVSQNIIQLTLTVSSVLRNFPDAVEQEGSHNILN